MFCERTLGKIAEYQRSLVICVIRLLFSSVNDIEDNRFPEGTKNDGPPKAMVKDCNEDDHESDDDGVIQTEENTEYSRNETKGNERAAPARFLWLAYPRMLNVRNTESRS